jgi:pimeloyl-ACP methyl ester carboxylesterase
MTSEVPNEPAREHPMSGTTEIRPFRVDMPDEAIADLRRRVAATCWPSKELVDDASQGVQQAMLQELARYWAAEHDWRRCEAELNALPQFKTEIDGVDIHFIHVKSRHQNALPLIITHGWPGSVIELLGVIGPLTDPTAHGGHAEDAFDLVIPSIPGYGFSGQPTETGWDPGRVAQAWAELMRRLGYDRYVAQGGDQGAAVTDAMARQAPAGLAGVHLNLLIFFPIDVSAAVFGGGPVPEGLVKRVAVALLSAHAERKDPATLGAVAAVFKRGYGVEMPEHPQTIGYALTDTPAGLAAWMLDHDADSYQKISRAFVDKQPAGGLTRDHILDNITLYWLTNTATSSARLYWEQGRSLAALVASGEMPPKPSLPVGFTVFPGEIYQAPRSWAEKVYPNLIYFNQAARGGHFAACEEPQLFSEEIRKAFKSLR